MQDIDDQRGTAAYLKVAERTLENWRYCGIGPTFIRVGGKAVRYRRADVDRWLEENARVPGASA